MNKNYYSKTRILDQTLKKSNKSVFLLFLMFVLGLSHTYAQDEFITTWTVEAGDLDITIPIFDKDKLDADDEIIENEDGITYEYNFTVDWGDGSTTTGITTTESEDDALTHTYDNPDTYEVKISGEFPAISFGDGDVDNRGKIQTVKHWGNIEWQSMRDAFRGCTNLQVTATDVPDLGGVTSMAGMFREASSLTGTGIGVDFNSWDVSNVTNMLGIFQSSPAFNGDISGWDVSNVGNMFAMFFQASSFRQDISGWDVSNVTNMGSMFRDAFFFNQDLGDWKLNSLNSETSLANIFAGSAMDCVNYSETLIGWAANEDIATRDIELTTLPYGSDADTETAIGILEGKGWVIPEDEASICSETVYIPDTNFREKLVNPTNIDNGLGVDTNGDGQISYAEAAAFTGLLGLHQREIEDLTGIEAFTNVTEIQIGNNNLGNAEVKRVTDNFVGLTSLKTNGNGLTELDLTNLPDLTYLEAHNNDLSSLDVTYNEKLTYLAVANQKASDSGGDDSRDDPSNLLRAGLEEIIGLGNLVDLDYLHVGQNALTSLDVSNNTKLTQVQAGNNKLTSFDASTLNQGVVDGVIVGIQRLDLKFNELLTLNLANGLNADANGDINPNFLSDGGLNLSITTFSVFQGAYDPHNRGLVCIEFDEDLANLQTFTFPDYVRLTYRGRAIFSNGPCNIDIPDDLFKKMLTTAVDDVVPDVRAIVDGEEVDAYGQGVDTDGNGEISYEEAASFTGTLELSNLRPQRIEDLTGIEAFTNLTRLYVYGNALRVIDVSKNVKLVAFNASGQEDEDENETLIALNVANGNNHNMPYGSGFSEVGNTNLSYVFVDDPLYSESEWTGDLIGDYVVYSKNYLMINNNYTATYDDDIDVLLKPIDANFHRRLLNHHINGDQESVDYVEGGNGGDGAGIAEEINIHNGMDILVENYTTGTTADGNDLLDPATVISYYEAAAFTDKLWLDGELINTSSYRTILDFNGDDDDTGLETFVNITELDMSKNFDIKEESLNLPSLTKLVELDLYSCNFGRIDSGGTLHEITTLDLSQNTALEKLNLSANDLTTLDVSNNLNLIELNVSDNRLAELTLLNNTALTNLDLSINDIEVLYVENNPNLTTLDFSRNYIKSIDLGIHSELEVLRSEFNELTSLDVSSNTKLTELSLYRNQLELLNIANGENQELTSLYLGQIDDESYSSILRYGGHDGEQRTDAYYTSDNNGLVVNENDEASCILVDDTDYSDSVWEFDKDYRFVDLKDFTTDYTAVLGVNGQYTLMPEDVYDSSQSDCLNVGLSFSSGSQTEFTCADVGTVVDVLLIATYGDKTYIETASVGITLETQVTAVTQDITVTLDANGQATIAPDDIDDGSVVVCGTGNVTLSLDRTNFSVDDIGTPVTVTLTVTDQSTNASVTATAQVTVVAFDPDNPDPDEENEDNSIAAKGFSPNGDGIGDTWVIEGIQDYPGNTVQIFSQWGEAVYEANDYQNDFEGISNKTGGGRKRLPAGPYLYIINFNDAAMAPERGWVYINY